MCIRDRQVEKKVSTLLDVYTKVFKSKRNTEVEIRKKDNFKSDMGSLFDIASPQAEKILRQDRLLRDPCKKGEKKSKAEEDLEFLEDQRGKRVMEIGEGDDLYTEKVDTQKKNVETEARKRKHHEENVENEKQEEKKARKDQMNDLLSSITDSEKDEDYEGKIRQETSKSVLVELPRKIFESPEVVSMLDRTKNTSKGGGDRPAGHAGSAGQQHSDRRQRRPTAF